MAVLFMNIRRRSVNAKSFNFMVDYYSRDEAVNDDPLDPDHIEEMLAYYGRFDTEEVTTGFDTNGDKTTLQAKREFELHQPEQVYQTIISFKKEDAERLGIKTKDDFYQVGQAMVSSASKELDIKPWNLVWTGFLHENTENPHIHIYFFDKTRIEQPLFRKKQIYKIRSALGRRILNQTDLLQLKDAQMKQTYEEATQYISTKNLENLIKSRMVIGHGYQELSNEDKDLVKALKECAEVIPLRGRLGSAHFRDRNPEVYEKVQAVKELLLKDSPGFKEFSKTVNELHKNYETFYGGKQMHSYHKNYEAQQHRNSDTKINNMIIKFVVKHRDVLTHPDFKISNPPNTLMSGLMTLEKNAFFQMRQGIGQMVAQSSQGKDNKDQQREDYEYEAD